MSTTVSGSYDHSPYWLQTSSGTTSATGVSVPNATQNVSVFQNQTTTQNTANVNNSVLSDGCDDGKDDGKITLWSGICAFGKGIVKSAVNTVKGILTDPKKLITTVATAAVCVAFPYVGVALGVVGMVTGGISLAKSAATAYDIYQNGGTDAEMKAAIQDAGGAALQIGLSYAGTKASIKAMKGTTGSAMSELKPKAGFRKTAEAFWKDVRTGGKGGTNPGDGYIGTQIVNNVVKNVRNEGGLLKGLRKSASDGYNKVKTSSANRAAQKEYNKYEKMDAEAQQKFLKEMSDDIDKATTRQVEAQKAVNELKGKGAAAENASPELKAQLDKANGELKTANQVLENAKARQTNFHNAETSSSIVQDNLLDAKSNLEKAQKAYDNAIKAGGKGETELAALNNAKTALQKAQADVRLASSSPISYNRQRFSNLATSAGYSSGFGALTSPLSLANSMTNAEDMTLEAAQYQAAVNNASFGSVTTPGSSNYTFNTQFQQRDYAAMAEQANANVMRTLNYYAY